MYSGVLEDLELALGIVNEVDAYSLEHFFAQDFEVYEKPDLTPVSEVDRQVEQMIREILATHRPEDQIYGEEYGEENIDELAASASTQSTEAGNDLPTIENPLAPAYTEEGAVEAETTNSPSAKAPQGAMQLPRLSGKRGPGRPRKDAILETLPVIPRRRWIIDPIDGTKNYVRGVPVWATLLALEVDGEIVLGVVSAPALNRRWWAGKNLGAWTQFADRLPTKLKVSQVKNSGDMSVSYSSISSWQKLDKQKQMTKLLSTAWRNRAYGDFWSYMLVAEGTVDLALEPELELYDMAALVPIVEEAGGTFTGVNGKPGCGHGNAIASNGHLHQLCLDILNS